MCAPICIITSICGFAVMPGFDEFRVAISSLSEDLDGWRKKHHDQRWGPADSGSVLHGRRAGRRRESSVWRPGVFIQLQPAKSVRLKNSVPQQFTVRKQYCIAVRHARALVEHFAGRMGVPAKTLTSHQLRAFLTGNGIYAPEHVDTERFFTSNFPSPDVIITYTWSSPLEVVLLALEEALSPHEFSSFNLWLDVFCLHQVNVGGLEQCLLDFSSSVFFHLH